VTNNFHRPAVALTDSTDTSSEELSQPTAQPKKTTKVEALVPQSRSFAVLMSIVQVGLTGFSILVSFFVIWLIISSNRTLTVPYAIDKQGNRLKLSQITNEADKNQHISDYATWMAVSLHSYRWYVPGADNSRKADPGVKVNGGDPLPTAVWMGTLSMAPDLAIEYQPLITKLLKDKKLTDTRAESVFKPIHTSAPIKVGSERWEVYVDGIQINRTETGETKNTRRYKKFLITSAPTISKTVAEAAYKEPGLQEAYSDSASWGLMTLGIQDIKNQQASPAKDDSKNDSKKEVKNVN
jgi:hypothetical protein